MQLQRLYNGVRFPMDGPSPRNVAILDHYARPYVHACMTTGMLVDLEHFRQMEKTLTEDMERITEEVRQEAGRYINLDSGDQVADLLFRQLGLKQARRKMTKSESRESVENEVLVAIQHEHPVVSKILDFKELSKLRGTYVAPMPRLARRGPDGLYRMYPKLGDTRVPSGRLNCKEPNLLAMPARTKRGKEVAKGFVAGDGWVFVSVDESQIEPRVCAHRSGDKNLIRVYENKEDIYSDFAINAFSLPDKRYLDTDGWHYPGVDKDEHRFPSKTCTLASIYDVTEVGLVEQMPVICKNCRKKAADHDCGRFEPLWNEVNCLELIQAFYRTYPGILSMRAEDHRRARRFGYLWDEWGRILHVAAVRSVLQWVVSAALREAGNFPIQSTAQGTVKLAQAVVMDDIDRMKLHKLVQPQLQVHDELLFRCHRSIAQDWMEHVKEVFENIVRLAVPVKAGGAMAYAWGSIQK